MTIGERIKARREELSLSQAELAKRMGYKSRAAICNVEKDKEDLTTNRIRKFAEALETTPSYLMGWDDEAESSPAIKSLIDVYVQQSSDRVLLDLYHNAPDEVQRMVDYLLGYPKPDGEDPQVKNDKD